MSNDLALPYLTNLFKVGGTGTAKEMGLRPNETVYAHRMQESGLIQYSGERKGKRGRPAHLYRLTDKARKRVRRALEV